MKKTMKTASGVLAFVLSIGMLTGCGNSDGSFKNSKAMIDKYSGMVTLGEYKGIEYEEVNTEVTDEDVQSKIDSLLSEHTAVETLTEGTAEDGQTVNIDFVGKINGEEFEGGSSDGQGYDLVLGSGTMIDGFEEQIVGHSVGETFDIDTTFPDDYSKEELQGVDAVFTITINSIVNETLPDYTDEFVAANTDYSTIADYEKSVREELVASKKETDDITNKSTIVEILVENATVNEYPKQEMQKLVDEAVENVSSQASNYGYDLSSYVSAVYGMESEDEFKEYVSSQVQDYMKEKVVICAVADAENITASKDEINDYKAELMTKYGMSEEELAEYYSDDDMMYATLSDKVVDFLLENATPVESTEETTEAESEEAAEETTEAESEEAAE